MESNMYTLKITMESVAPDGKVFQKISVDEYSDCPEIHIKKNMVVANAVMGGFASLSSDALETLNKKC